MPILTCANLSFSWPDGTPVFSGLDLSFGLGRHGLIGRNGCGKSTLLRLLAGELPPDGGSLSRNADVAYLPQTIAASAGDKVADLLGISEQLAALDAIAAGSSDPECFAAVGNDWDLEERTRGWLAKLCPSSGLATRPNCLHSPVSSLSGGEAMAVALTGIILRRPGIALLDEPTNNLDADARRWFLHALAEWAGVLLIASHDRELLEAMDSIVEMEEGRLKRYGGGFSLYRARSEAEREAAERTIRDAEAVLDREKRRRAEAETRGARSRKQGVKMGGQSRYPTGALRQRKSYAEAAEGRQRLAREARVADAAAELRDAKAAARRDEDIVIDFPETTVPAGQTVLEFVHGGKSFRVCGPERIVLSGRNGSGKSTLLRTLAGRAESAAFRIEKIAAGVGYLPQRLEQPDASLDVLAALRQAAPHLSDNTARARLAQFLIKGGRARQPAATLSGGERFRLALACLLSAEPPPRLLLLDEPTNNLDLASVAELAAALSGYKGAMIVVSHDRRFLDDLGMTREWKMRDMGIASDKETGGDA